jgi:hypothetical protein
MVAPDVVEWITCRIWINIKILCPACYEQASIPQHGMTAAKDVSSWRSGRHDVTCRAVKDTRVVYLVTVVLHRVVLIASKIEDLAALAGMKQRCMHGENFRKLTLRRIAASFG